MKVLKLNSLYITDILAWQDRTVMSECLKFFYLTTGTYVAHHSKQKRPKEDRIFTANFFPNKHDEKLTRVPTICKENDDAMDGHAMIISVSKVSLSIGSSLFV